MKKQMMALLLVILTVCTTLLAGCAGKKSGAKVASVPAGGIVRKADFEQLKQSGGIAIYKGTGNGFQYTWTFVGRDIKNPKDMNLRVSVKSGVSSAIQADRQISFSLAQKGAFPGKASLSITVGKSWTYDTMPLHTGQADAPQTAGTVQVVDGVATVSLSANAGPYFFTQGQPASSAVSSTSSAPASAASSVPSSSRSQTISRAASQVSKPVSSAASKASPSASSSANTIRVSLTIRCDTALKNWSSLATNKQDNRVVPASGVILPQTEATLNPGQSAYDLLVSVCKAKGIQMEHQGAANGKSDYIEGINNLYEFDAGSLSGWMYEVNGQYPAYGVSEYVLKNGDAVQFNYTCDLGRDIGAPG